jgi:citrate lyase subunit beta/citryl-CoA lyase
VLVPKISSPQDIDTCQSALAAAPEAMPLWAMIETCSAVPQLHAIAAKAATTRLSLWVMGVNDLAKEMRARLTPERTPFLPVLTLAVAAARAHGVAILDGVCNEFRDVEAFKAEAAQGVLFGFDGKSLIHPDQIAPCNEAFSPSEEELRWARVVIEAFQQPEAQGKGAIKVEGKMVELLHMWQAKQLVAVADMIAASQA